MKWFFSSLKSIFSPLIWGRAAVTSGLAECSTPPSHQQHLPAHPGDPKIQFAKGYVIPPPSHGPTLETWPGWMCLEHLKGEASWRHPDQMCEIASSDNKYHWEGRPQQFKALLSPTPLWKTVAIREQNLSRITSIHRFLSSGRRIYRHFRLGFELYIRIRDSIFTLQTHKKN